jgi:uncharacterized coiled-coil DUF342 family protein
MMKLAEALIIRADTVKKLTQLRSRMVANAKVQEGETPAEDFAELLTEFNELMAEQANLIKRINRTNAETAMGDCTIADAIAERDSIKSKIGCYREAYNATAIIENRYSRNEIKFVRCINPLELQKQIDSLSKQYREIDTAIQALNWATDLSE